MSKSRVSEALEGICGNLKKLNLFQSNPKEAKVVKKEETREESNGAVKEDLNGGGDRDVVKKEEPIGDAVREEGNGGGDGDADKEEEKVQGYDAFKEAAESVPTVIVDERLVAEYRAKLYRFDNSLKQWKEKGIGNITILQSIENFKKCRVVMWTRVTGKVACNFSLYPEMSVTSYQKSPKILCWKALDSSTDEEPLWETFTCRFLSEEECTDFKNNVLKYAKDPPPISEPTSENESDDCEKSDCPGCIGCNPDAYEFREPKPAEVKVKESPVDIPLASDSCKEIPCLVEPSMFKCL